jgi:predicted permease
MSFNLLFSTFANNILPIILISGAGFLLGKLITVDSRTLGRVVFYLFSPLLIFDLLLKSKLDYQQAVTTIAYTATVITTLCILAFLLGKLLRLKRPMLLAVIITVAFGNTGNYGLPLISFAFGEQALAYASIYFVTTTILLNTVGVLIASLGHMDFKTALLGLFKVPLIYAVALALLLNSTGFILPVALVRTIDGRGWQYSAHACAARPRTYTRGMDTQFACPRTRCITAPDRRPHRWHSVHKGIQY